MCYGLGDYKSTGLIGQTFFTTDFKSVGTPSGGQNFKSVGTPSGGRVSNPPGCLAGDFVVSAG